MKKFLKKIGSFTKEEFVGTWRGISKEKISFSTFVLVTINVVALLVSNIIAARSFEFGFVNGLRFALPIAVLIYPIVICISDTLAQQDWVWTRRSCHISFIANAFMVIMFEIAIAATGGRNGDFAILSNAPYLLLASFVSFYLSDLVNDEIFKRLKEKDGDSNGKLVKRCVISTLFGQIVDASIFIILGMHVFPILANDVSLMSSFSKGYLITSLSDPIGWANVGIMIGLQIAVKVFYEFALSPIIIWLCNRSKKSKTNVITK